MNINLMAPINTLSYGYVGLNVFKTLLERKHDVTYYPIGNIEAEQKYHKAITEAIYKQASFDRYAPTVRIFHQFSMAESIGLGMRIGWPIFELNKFKDNELNHLRSLDRTVVCSEWAKEIALKHNLGNTCYVVPLGVDTSIFYPQENAPKTKGTRFLNIGKWEKRKGHDILIEAFCKAFEPSDDVYLTMHCYNPFLSNPQNYNDGNASWANLYKNNKLGDKITVNNYKTSFLQPVADIINAADCCVFPSRAEGWNMPLLEAMACGKKVITTNYSAHTEYCTADNALLINIDELEPAHDNIWFHGEGEWACIDEPQIDQLIEHMRAVHREKQQGGGVFNNEGLKTAAKYSWNNTVSLLEKVLPDEETF